MPVLCLVPHPLRGARLARRLCDAEGGVLFGARVETPDAAAARVLALAGERRPLLSTLAERMLATESAGAALRADAPGAPAGLVAALAGAVAELRRAEVSAAEVAAAAEEAGAGSPLRPAAAALAAYEARLAGLDALDHAAAARAAATALARGAAREERPLDLLVVEGFRALPPASFDLVAALAGRARRTHLRLPFCPERPDVCAPAEPLLRQVEALHELAARREITVALDDLDAGGARAPRLARALRAIAGGDGGTTGSGATAPERAGGPAGEGLVLAAAAGDAAGEAEAAAALAVQLLEAGFAAEDVVLVGGGAEAPARLARAFAEAGVPFASGRGSPLGEEPPVRAVRQALGAALAPGRAALEQVLGSAYLRLGRPPARLGLWLDRAGALDGRGDPEQALRRRADALTAPAAAPERAALLRAADALRDAASALRPLAARGTPREHAARLRALMAEGGSRRRAARGEAALARRELAALTRLEETVDELVRALALLGRAGERLDAAAWRDLLELALQGASAPAPAEPASGAVELWPLSDAPGLSARAAILVGCARGAFPPASHADPFLGEGERAAIRRACRRPHLASGALRRAEALHEAFCALAAGREAVALTWAGEGPGDVAPAPLAAELLAAAGAAPPEPRRDPSLERCRTRGEALRAVARAARVGEAGSALGALERAAPELAARAASVLARGGIEEERQAAVAARRSSPFAGALPPSLGPQLDRAWPDEWTPSQLETHARCPFRLFAGLALGLVEPESGDVDVDPRDEGSLVHAVLERFLAGRRDAGALPLRADEEERRTLAGVAAAVFARFESDGRTGDPAVWAGRRAAVCRRLERVLAAEAAQESDALPTLLEHRFGGGSGVPPLTFREGELEVKLRGRLDRVDASADRLVLLDYKDARAGSAYRAKLEREALGETNFQVPAYLMAAARALPGRGQLEASYLLLRSAERLPPFACDAVDPLFAAGEEERAAARASGARPFGDAVLAAVRRIRGGDLPIASRDCGGCGLGAVCRFERRAEEDP